jgi:hypothetical protein
MLRLIRFRLRRKTSVRWIFLRRCSLAVSANKLLKRRFSLTRALYLSFLWWCLAFDRLIAIEQENQTTIASDINIVETNA